MVIRLILLGTRASTVLLLTLAATLLAPAPPARAQPGARQRQRDRGGPQSYTTVSNISVTPLSNGVQIRIVADGILQYTNADMSGPVMRVSFPQARNGTGKNFFRVDRYPVSYIQVQTPQTARSGIGLDLRINNFVNTNANITSSPDGQGVLITVQSDRTIERGPRRPGTGGAAGGGATDGEQGERPDVSTTIRFENGKLLLRAVRADIHELMGAIAEKTGVSVAVDDAVDRKVSLNLQNVTPEAAVQSIATAYGLALSRIGGVTMISEGVPTDLATYRLSGTESFRMQNTQAQTASSLLPNFLFSYVKVNPEQNAVVVTAPSQMLAKIGRDLRAVDVPSPQILLEAIAVEFTNTTDLDLGLTLKDTQRTFAGALDTNNGTISYTTIGKLPRNFEATLRALELNGKARVRARPQMAAVNGRTADIFIGAQRFILTQFNSFGQTQTRIQPVDVGVKLSVTPLTGGNDEITVRIAPEVSNITELDLQSGLPVLSTRSANTTVRVQDGETIAIGGLTLNQEQSTNRKIPILGDLPLVGGLFRSRSRNIVQTELVVFVTPRILPPSVPAAAAPTAPPAGAPPPPAAGLEKGVAGP